MTIGLVRHFKVQVERRPFWQTPKQFAQSLASYDNSPVQISKINLGNINWDVCYSSTLSRAIETAQSIYSGQVIQSDLLKEVPMNPVTNFPIPLPSFIWRFCSRIAWYKSSKSQIENFPQTRERIKESLLLVEKSEYENILVVTHGFFMTYLAQSLIANGYKGKIDPVPKNGKLYLFTK